MVHAKDGTTPFAGSGQLQGGTLVFTMAPFSAVLPRPDAMAMNPTAATLAFTNMADPTAGTSPPRPTARRVAIERRERRRRLDLSRSRRSAGGAWPAGATIVVTVDATTTNLLGQTIAAAATVTFTAP